MTKEISRYPSQPDFRRLFGVSICEAIEKIHARLALLGREDSNLRLADPESADNSNGPTTSTHRDLAANHANAAGAAGTPPDESADILALEERLLVALAARGERRIGEFIARAVLHADPPLALGPFSTQLYQSDDDDLVRALEREAFWTAEATA